jgi:hypothetical protein
MSKSAGKCVFCGKARRLTHSHVWPDWVAKILPQTATHHEQIIGKFDTFVPKMKGLPPWQRIRQGHVGSRKPRNTCLVCNGGWMRHIEEATMAIMPPLLLGRRLLLTLFEQRALAASMCLVSMRTELSGREMRAIPQTDRDWLMAHSEPPPHWKIWIARYEGAPRMDERYSAMQVASSPDVVTGVEHCNSQVTTLVIGQLCAHMFSSTVWPDFSGYEGSVLAPIWPPRHPYIEVGDLPIITEADVSWLHEAIPRELTPIASE